MKNQLLARTALAVLGTAPCAAMAEYDGKIYAYLSGAVENYDLSEADANSAVNNAIDGSERVTNYGSFFGFKGSVPVRDGISVIYQVESYVFIDDTGPSGFNAFAARNNRLGLSGSFGEVYFGKWDTPFRKLLANGSFPGATQDAGQILGNGVANSVNNTQALGAFARRQNNVLGYVSPSWNGLKADVLYGLGENETTAGDPYLLSGSLTFERSGWLLGAVYELHDEYGGKGTQDAGLGALAAYRWGPAKLSAFYTHFDYERLVGGQKQDLDADVWTLEGKYSSGDHTIKLSYTLAGDGGGSLQALSTDASGHNVVNPSLMVGQIASGSDTGASLAVIGYEFALNKSAQIIASYARLDNDARGSYALFGGVAPTTGALGVDTEVLSLGLRYYFL